MAQRFAHSQKGTVEIDRIDLPEFLQAAFRHGLAVTGDTGAVDQHIEPAETLDHLAGDLLPGRFVGYVMVQIKGIAAVFAQLRRQRLAGIVLQIGNRNLSPFARQHSRTGRADAGRPAGNQRDLVLYPWQILVSLDSLAGLGERARPRLCG